MKSYETLHAVARKNIVFHSKINGMGVVQGELLQVQRDVRQHRASAAKECQPQESSGRSYGHLFLRLPRQTQEPVFRVKPMRSPDVHAVSGRQIHLVALLHVERLVPGLEVPDRRDTEFIRAVRVGQELLPRNILLRNLPPKLRPGQKEALIPGESVDHGGFAARFPGDMKAMGIIGDRDTAEVADVFAQGERTVDVHPLDRGIAVVLLDQYCRARGELGPGRIRPPVPQDTVRVELAALIVEAVTELDACCAAWNRFANDPKTPTSLISRAWAKVS